VARLCVTVRTRSRIDEAMICRSAFGQRRIVATTRRSGFQMRQRLIHQSNRQQERAKIQMIGRRIRLMIRWIFLEGLEQFPPLIGGQ